MNEGSLPQWDVLFDCFNWATECSHMRTESGNVHASPCIQCRGDGRLFVHNRSGKEGQKHLQASWP